MPSMPIEEIEEHHPDRLMPPISPECAPQYWEAVERGTEIARDTDVTFVGLVRNSMPWLQLSADRLAALGGRFRNWRAFIYENDSDDGTDEFLRAWSTTEPRVTVQTERHDRPQLSTEKSKRRTDALAEYRQRCLDWARDHAPGGNHRVIVIDFDTWGGWSETGVMTGLWHLQQKATAAGMASVSTIELKVQAGSQMRSLMIHYDAWAFRLNHWTEHQMPWFPHWFPPVGSDPVRCRSAFGGMVVYRPEALFSGTYSGGDCEHVHLHRTIAERTGARMFLNPSQRMCMTWIPREAGDETRQHGDD